MKKSLSLLILTLLLTACMPTAAEPSSGDTVQGEEAYVTRVIDGDTIDVSLPDGNFRVRYIGIDTPERDEACYSEATAANRALVDRRTVTLVRDISETDQYGRLLRYIYVGNEMVNETLVREGWASVVVFPPDTANLDTFRQLEREARNANIGCYPTGVFD